PRMWPLIFWEHLRLSLVEDELYVLRCGSSPEGPYRASTVGWRGPTSNLIHSSRTPRLSGRERLSGRGAGRRAGRAREEHGSCVPAWVRLRSTGLLASAIGSTLRRSHCRLGRLASILAN